MLSRSFAGLNSKDLFGSSHLGTKYLVEEFLDEVNVCLHALSEAADVKVSLKQEKNA